jgi:hypothetical protein
MYTKVVEKSWPDLTLVGSHNNHGSSVSINTQHVVGMSMAGIVMLIVNIDLVEI